MAMVIKMLNFVEQIVMLMEKFDLLVDTRGSKTFLVLRIVFYVGSVILVMVGIAYFRTR